MIAKILLLSCLAATLVMTGLIWFVDRVHYPLFDRVGREGFAAYHAEHSRRTTAVVIGPMVVELVASLGLTIWRPSGSGPSLAWCGFAAALATWAATAWLAVPMHAVLGRGFDAAAHRRLMTTDAVRLAAWTLHSAILLAMTARALR